MRSPARVGGRAGDRLEVGDLVAEELAGRPAILAIEPAESALAGNAQALEGAVAGELATELVLGEGAGVVGVAPAVKDQLGDPPGGIQLQLELHRGSSDPEVGRHLVAGSCRPAHPEAGQQGGGQPDGFGA
jgi:hypothetical protein